MLTKEISEVEKEIEDYKGVNLYCANCGWKGKKMDCEWNEDSPITYYICPKCRAWMEKETIIHGLNTKLSTLKSAQAKFDKFINSPELLERLADLEHQQWSHWEKYRDGRLNTCVDFSGQLANWRRLREKSYQDLTDKEKESDRKLARKIIDELSSKQETAQ
jgi:hypothetical protein